LITRIWWGLHIIKLLITWFSPLPCYFVHLRPKILLRTLFSNTLSLRTCLSVSDLVSHPYEIGKIIVFYISHFKKNSARYCHKHTSVFM
jgi:DUF1365 family protein